MLEAYSKVTFVPWSKNTMSQKKEFSREKQLEVLVDELIKSKPSQKLILEMTSLLGIQYSADPIVQMSLVLEATSSMFKKSKNNKNETNGGLHV